LGINRRRRRSKRAAYGSKCGSAAAIRTAEETTAQIADGLLSIPEAVRISDLVNNEACEHAGHAEFCSELLGPHRSFLLAD
jgi:hypothetical protein